jgi:predicted ABC-type ATPase
MEKLYIIAGPNGAGKTTASYTVLPEIFECAEFINADEIARGISPLNPDSIAIQAGRIMINRTLELLNKRVTFAIETTLSLKSYVELINKARAWGYEVTLLYLWLKSPELAISRVKTRVKEGGHDIPSNVIVRRYKSGLRNLFKLYMPVVDNWIVVDNSGEEFQIIAEGIEKDILVRNESVWLELKNKYYEE